MSQTRSAWFRLQRSRQVGRKYALYLARRCTGGGRLRALMDRLDQHATKAEVWWKAVGYVEGAPHYLVDAARAESLGWGSGVRYLKALFVDLNGAAR